MHPPVPDSPRPGHDRFDGWRMVGVAFLCDFVAVGFFFYSYGVFFKALAVDFGGSRLGVSLGLTVSSTSGALVAPYLGALLDRVSIRRAMLAGALSVSVGFAGIACITRPWQYYLLLGTLVAFGLNALGGMAAAKLVANWFVVQRGRALGLATVGISLSGLVMPTVATWLVERVGWRGGFLAYAVGTLVLVVPVVAWLVVNRPEEVGQRPDGAPPTRDSATPGEPLERLWSTAEILASRNFWALSLCFALCFACLSAVLTHVVPHATDLGIAPTRAAWVLSAAAGAGMLSKVFFGWLVDRTDPRLAVILSVAGQLGGVLLLLLGDAWRDLLAAAVVFGFGMGGVIPLQGAITGIAFGRLSFGKVSGLLRPFMVPMTALGVPLAGWIYDRTASYDRAFQLFVALYLLAALAALALRLGPLRRPAGLGGAPRGEPLLGG